jgi:hypothetical protein
MDLFTKIITLYPSLTVDDFSPRDGTIELVNLSDGNGDHIAKWEHPTLARPTEEQLA